MDILRAAQVLRPGTSWNLLGGQLSQAEDAALRVAVPTQVELDSVSAQVDQAVLVDQRTSAKNDLGIGKSSVIMVARAVAFLLKDEINILRQRDVDRAADVAAATSLADLKVRWAARSALDPRTVQQAKNAVANQLDSGAAD